jgi:antitoxin (DNA-binding transcriptional repressor) of toxin-antitoxin stability system
MGSNMTIAVCQSHRARARWRDVLDMASNGTDVVIYRYDKPVAAVITYADFVALRDELEDLRAARRAATIYEEWKRDPSSARPYADLEQREQDKDAVFIALCEIARQWIR